MIYYRSVLPPQESIMSPKEISKEIMKKNKKVKKIKTVMDIETCASMPQRYVPLFRGAWFSLRGMCLCAGAPASTIEVPTSVQRRPPPQ